ncbi:MAG: hypothetical protein A4E49_03324 [Methanosaeta sp. PtaU1.Bin112]|nr:MAG: hypothetical protein A4E49_03324 [Methanosaeta sp. PtaU1.Bin112]
MSGQTSHDSFFYDINEAAAIFFKNSSYSNNFLIAWNLPIHLQL